MLALDLLVLHRDAHVVGKREALAWSAFWIGLAAIFCVGVFVLRGSEQGIEWATGYLVEKSLSVDNLFVFILVFAAFNVPPRYQHRVLFWGVAGAIVMRIAFILAGSAILDTFHVAIYFFGALLIFTAAKFLRDSIRHTPPVPVEHTFVVRIARRLIRVWPAYDGQKFFVRREGLLYATPLFLVLLVIEASDIMFAIDSIPAIFAITDDTFIVFTSNIFAILGLRALYFLLAGSLQEMPYLKPALAAVLGFVGVKMLLADVYHIPPLVSLGVIAGILAVAVVASLLGPKPKAHATPAIREGEPVDVAR
jgi:tellurite resistance protein TerC